MASFARECSDFDWIRALDSSLWPEHCRCRRELTGTLRRPEAGWFRVGVQLEMDKDVGHVGRAEGMGCINERCKLKGFQPDESLHNL
jgi:hypothetical protein